MTCDICKNELPLTVFEYPKIRRKKHEYFYENCALNICQSCKSNLEILNIKSQVRNIRMIKNKSKCYNKLIIRQVDGQMNIKDFNL